MFTRGRNSALASNVFGSTDGDGTRVAANNNSQQKLEHNLIKEQYSQLLQLLGSFHVKSDDTSEDTKDLSNDFITGHGAVNPAGSKTLAGFISF